MRVEPSRMGFDRAVELEWLLTNGLGGYSSSTVLELNTRKYHGLLVSSLKNLKRVVCLQKMEDAIQIGGNKTELHCSEFDGSFIQLPGFESLTEFNRGLNEVCFVHETPEFTLDKRINLPFGKNAVILSYTTVNKTNEGMKHIIQPHVNYRSIHELSREGDVAFNTKVSGKTALVSLGGKQLAFVASDGVAKPEGIWVKNIYYRREAERGYPAVEDSFIPFTLSVDLKAGAKKEYHIAVAFDGVKVTSEEILRTHGTYESEDLVMLLASANSFIVGIDKKKTVVAGYHWFGEWGRDAMISLPGLTLVENKLEDAGRILERFLGKVQGGRIMTESESGPVYRDYDSTLWMIDRIMKFIKYVGPDVGLKFLNAHWSTMMNILGYYSGLEYDGLILHKNGTWMDTLKRDNAVEVQALWYNALRVCDALAKFSGYSTGHIHLRNLIRSFEANFKKTYWTGEYLKDCIGDRSFRPNQLIALSLEYPCVGKNEANMILSKVEENLLTPVGLRTLHPKDNNYRGSYTGGVAEREVSYHNGTVWPWLLGPYIKAHIRFRGVDERLKAKAFLNSFFKHAMNACALGSVGEVFDGDYPHTPRGCVSQAWSVGEPLRAYLEDVLGRKPRYENLFT